MSKSYLCLAECVCVCNKFTFYIKVEFHILLALLSSLFFIFIFTFCLAFHFGVDSLREQHKPFILFHIQSRSPFIVFVIHKEWSQHTHHSHFQWLQTLPGLPSPFQQTMARGKTPSATAATLESSLSYRGHSLSMLKSLVSKTQLQQTTH